jgi:hypothetical protein
MLYIIGGWALFMVFLMASAAGPRTPGADPDWKGKVTAELNFGQKRNMTYEQGVKPLTRYLIDDILKGKLAATDKDGNPVTKEQAQLMIRPADTVMVMDEKTSELVQKIYRRDITDDLYQALLEEDMSYDSSTGKLTANLKRLGIYRDIFSNTGRFLRQDVVFWVNVN